MAERFAQQGFRVARRTTLNQEAGPYDVLIVDTFGELRTLYAVGDVAFIGSSLVRINERGGGHNPLEPLTHGVIPLYGPFMSLWRPVTEELHRVWPGLEVGDAEQLAERASQVFSGAAPVAAIREVGLRLVDRSAGAVERTAVFLRRHLALEEQP